MTITRYKKYLIRVVEKPKRDRKVLYEPSIHGLPYPPMNQPKQNLPLKEFKTEDKAINYAKK